MHCSIIHTFSYVKTNSLISLSRSDLINFRMPKRVISKICYDKSDIGAGFESIWTVIDKTLETLLIIREFCDFFPKKNKIKIYQEQSEENKRYWKNIIVLTIKLKLSYINGSYINYLTLMVQHFTERKATEKILWRLWIIAFWIKDYYEERGRQRTFIYYWCIAT